MKAFVTPAEVIAHQEHEGHQHVIQDLLDKCTAALLDEFDGQRVLVEYPKNTPEAVKRRIKDHIQASGWVVKFYDGQTDGNINGTYNMEIRKP